MFDPFDLVDNESPTIYPEIELNFEYYKVQDALIILWEKISYSKTLEINEFVDFFKNLSANSPYNDPQCLLNFIISLNQKEQFDDKDFLKLQLQHTEKEFDDKDFLKPQLQLPKVEDNHFSPQLLMIILSVYLATIILIPFIVACFPVFVVPFVMLILLSINILATLTMIYKNDNFNANKNEQINGSVQNKPSFFLRFKSATPLFDSKTPVNQCCFPRSTSVNKQLS